MNRARIISAAGDAVFFQISHQLVTVVAIDRIQAVSRFAVVENALFSEIAAQFGIITFGDFFSFNQFFFKNGQFLQNNGSLERVHARGQAETDIVIMVFGAHTVNAA